MVKTLFRCAVYSMLLGSMTLSMSVQAKLYKWVDENGQVHYGDKVPPKYLKTERQELNEQGALVKKYDRAMTAEEKAEKRRLEAEQRKRENEKRAQALRDRVLTDTYTTERDLIAAREARLDAVDSQIQLAEDIINDSAIRVEKTEKLIMSLRDQNKIIPEATYAKLEREKYQLATQKGIAEGHRIKRQEIIEQFDGYILRFRELMEAKRIKREKQERRRINKERAARGLPPLEYVDTPTATP